MTLRHHPGSSTHGAPTHQDRAEGEFCGIMAANASSLSPGLPTGRLATLSDKSDNAVSIGKDSATTWIAVFCDEPDR
jgi:hypothetical protein